MELLKYVEITDDDEYIGLFRIMPKLTRKNSQSNYVQFQCEHVLATLMDSSLFKYHQRSNFTTNSNIDYLLSRQNHKHWKRGKGEFTRYFHYGWENENLLSAIFSVPKPFDEPYLWEHDTTSYPWTLDLVKPDDEPVCRIKEGYNLVGLEIEENPMNVYNRIYPLGAGEGVNQLTIESVNGGVPYLEDRQPGEEIKEYIWVDKRFTDIESLKASGQALLDKWKKPIITWIVSAADVSKITGLSIDKFKIGKVVRLDIEGLPVTDLRIMKESKPDIKGDPGNIQLEMGNVQEDLSTTHADLERRQQINELYSQGATNIDSRDFADNCDPSFPAMIRFPIPDDVVNVNIMTLTFETQRYRAYSKAIEGGGAVVSSTASGGSSSQTSSSGGGSTATSSSGGGTTATSTSGGGVAKSTATGGDATRTSSAGGDHTHVVAVSLGSGTVEATPKIYQSLGTTFELKSSGSGGFVTWGGSGNHSHSVTVPAHSHSFDVPNHAHNVTIANHSHSVVIPSHTHKVDIPAHKHDITLPNHVHEIQHGIYEFYKLPTAVQITVDGTALPMTAINGDQIDLIPYLKKDSSGNILRGRYAEIKLAPNNLARINATVSSRLFIQSQIGGTF